MHACSVLTKTDVKEMRYFFSPEGKLAIARLMQHRVLLAFDFDGTLAPIVANPEDARVPLPVAKCLATLSARHPIAIITGRKLSDVKSRLGFEPTYVVGNHGAEGLDWEPKGTALQVLRDRLNLQANSLREAGIRVEDKGLSFALHFRTARNREEARRALKNFTADLPSGLSAFDGKCVLNIVLSTAPDKGKAALGLLKISGCESLLFVGDDANDEAVFSCANSDWLTVRVGQSKDASCAMFFLNSHSEMVEFLTCVQRA